MADIRQVKWNGFNVKLNECFSGHSPELRLPWRKNTTFFILGGLQYCKHTVPASLLNSYPSGFQQLPSKFLCWVVEGELLTAQMIDRWVALQVKEQIVIKADFLGFFLRRSGVPPREAKERSHQDFTNTTMLHSFRSKLHSASPEWLQWLREPKV